MVGLESDELVLSDRAAAKGGGEILEEMVGGLVALGPSSPETLTILQTEQKRERRLERDSGRKDKLRRKDTGEKILDNCITKYGAKRVQLWKQIG